VKQPAVYYCPSLHKSGFQVWSRAEVVGLLNSVNTAISDLLAALPDTPEIGAYRGGHQHTMRAVAHSFGLEYSNRDG